MAHFSDPQKRRTSGGCKEIPNYQIRGGRPLVGSWCLETSCTGDTHRAPDFWTLPESCSEPLQIGYLGITPIAFSRCKNKKRNPSPRPSASPQTPAAPSAPQSAARPQQCTHRPGRSPGQGWELVPQNGRAYFEATRIQKKRQTAIVGGPVKKRNTKWLGSVWFSFKSKRKGVHRFEKPMTNLRKLKGESQLPFKQILLPSSVTPGGRGDEKKSPGLFICGKLNLGSLNIAT